MLCIRSAQAVRTPVSATPMLQLPSLNELHGGNEHQETTKQPRAPSWTPMRSSTVALVDKFEQRDMPTSKRARPQSPVANASSTPLIGSGISSLQSYALQTPVYRRRVRACHESVASRHKEGLPALPPALDEEQQVESNASRLSTETARRILMTLRSMASKVKPN